MKLRFFFLDGKTNSSFNLVQKPKVAHNLSEEFKAIASELWSQLVSSVCEGHGETVGDEKKLVI